MAINKYMQEAIDRDYSVDWKSFGTFDYFMQQRKPPLPGRPISVRENYKKTLWGQQPHWIPVSFYDATYFTPDPVQEHPIPGNEDGFDYWGVEWIYDKTIAGSMVKPGTRVITDFAKWKEQVDVPDLSLLDFKTDGEKMQKILDPDRPTLVFIPEGIFERLHELMPFDEALLAFYEEPELLDDFFGMMADYKINCVKPVFEYYGQIDGVYYSDDWGTQRAGFFSNDMFDEQLMPHEKKFIQYVKSTGRYFELHSCGRNMQYVPEMIEMGADMWTPQSTCNDLDYLFKNFNEKITFTFPVDIPAGADEQTVREAVRDFVEKYGKNGRIMASIMAPPEVAEIARDELYNYSLQYYNKLYGRA